MPPQCYLGVQIQLPIGIHWDWEEKKRVLTSPSVYYFVLPCWHWMGVEAQLPSTGVGLRVKSNDGLIKSYCLWVEVEVHFITSCFHLPSSFWLDPLTLPWWENRGTICLVPLVGVENQFPSVSLLHHQVRESQHLGHCQAGEWVLVPCLGDERWTSCLTLLTWSSGRQCSLFPWDGGGGDEVGLKIRWCTWL